MFEDKLINGWKRLNGHEFIHLILKIMWTSMSSNVTTYSCKTVISQNTQTIIAYPIQICDPFVTGVGLSIWRMYYVIWKHCPKKYFIQALWINWMGYIIGKNRYTNNQSHAGYNPKLNLREGSSFLEFLTPLNDSWINHLVKIFLQLH